MNYVKIPEGDLVGGLTGYLCSLASVLLAGETIYILTHAVIMPVLGAFIGLTFAHFFKPWLQRKYPDGIWKKKAESEEKKAEK